MTIKHLFPKAKPVLNLDFANARELDRRITFTRGSTATYVGSDGLIKTAASGEARFDHDPVTGESLGLLVEESRTNNSIHSEDTSLWDNVGTKAVNTAANVIAAPDGNSTADNIYGDSGGFTAKEIRSSDITVPNGSYIITSVYAKKVPSSKYGFINLGISIVGGSAGARCNLSTGEVINSGGVEGYSQRLPHGWYRFVAYLKNTSGSPQTWPANTLRVFATTTSSDANGAGSGTGSATDGVYLWGRQAEVAAAPAVTSYIPTTTAAATRAADVASMTGTNFSSWFNQSEGTFTNHIIALEGAENRGNVDYGAWVGASNTTNRIRSEYAGLGTITAAQIYPTNPAPGVINSEESAVATAAPVIDRKSACAYNYDSVGFALNGVIGKRSSSNPAVGTLTDADRMYLTGFNGNNGLNKRISRVSYYPTRLSDEQLQALTL